MRKSEGERESEKEGEIVTCIYKHVLASRMCGRALSIPHSFNQSVSMRDYYIDVRCSMLHTDKASAIII